MFNFFKRSNDPVLVDIIEDRSTPNFQETLVLQERYLLPSMIQEANAQLTAKALGYLQAGSIILGLFTLLNLDPLLQALDQAPLVAFREIPVQTILLGCSFAMFLLMIIFSIRVITPTDYLLPGAMDWEGIYKRYLHAKPEDCYRQILSNVFDSIKHAHKLNVTKSFSVKWCGVCLVLQVSLS